MSFQSLHFRYRYFSDYCFIFIAISHSYTIFYQLSDIIRKSSQIESCEINRRGSLANLPYLEIYSFGLINKLPYRVLQTNYCRLLLS